jgi:RimJ/RimL family protein N-acetyltransferase
MDRSLASLAPPVSGRLGAVTSARLELTPIDVNSAERLAPIFAKEEVWRFPYGRGLTLVETEAFVRSWIEHWNLLGFGLWQVTEREEASTLGYVGLSVPTFLPEVLPAVEVGWRLTPSAWGHGYASQAAAVALTAAFEVLGLQEVLSLPQVDNPASVRVAERVGMLLDRTAIVPATEERGPVEVAVMRATNPEGRTRISG